MTKEMVEDMIAFSDLMDNLLYPSPKYSRSINANRKLSADEIFILFDFVNDFNTQKWNFDWAIRLKDIADVVYNHQPVDTDTNSVKKNANATKIPKSFAMPFLVRQVLLYTAVSCHMYKKRIEPLPMKITILKKKKRKLSLAQIAILKKKKRKREPLATQAAILDELNKYKEANPKLKNKLKLSHNFYSKMRVTDLINTVYYKQPDPLFLYPGQKSGELGVALKHLIYQAGAYNLFIDVFGGSGAASVAFPRRNNSVYLYNDLDEDLVNLFDVISEDELYLTLIDYIKSLQYDLLSYVKSQQLNLFRAADIEFNPLNLDLKQETLNIYKKGNSEDTANEVRIIHDLESTISHPKSNKPFVIEFMHKLYDKMEASKIYDKEKKAFFDDWGGIKNDDGIFFSYLINFTKIAEFVNKSFYKFDKGGIFFHNATNGTEEVNMAEFIRRMNQLRFYEHYTVFNNVLKNKDTYEKNINLTNPVVDANYRVFLAVAKIFTMQFLTNGQPGASSIYRIYNEEMDVYSKDGGSESRDWKRFLETDFESIITALHKRLRKNDTVLTKRKHKSTKGANRTLAARTIIEHMDCIALLKSYAGRSNMLIYSDSPYEATTGYSVGNFASDAMENFLTQLKQMNSKFIFSCRACVSPKDTDKDKDKDKDRKKIQKNRDLNSSIWENVFKKIESIFSDESLYVLTIDTISNNDTNKEIRDKLAKGKVVKEAPINDFWDVVKRNRVAEVMITNYDIYGFTDLAYPDAVYTSYPFKKFMDLLDKNMFK